MLMLFVAYARCTEASEVNFRPPVRLFRDFTVSDCEIGIRAGELAEVELGAMDFAASSNHARLTATVSTRARRSTGVSFASGCGSDVVVAGCTTKLTKWLSSFAPMETATLHAWFST